MQAQVLSTESINLLLLIIAMPLKLFKFLNLAKGFFMSAVLYENTFLENCIVSDQSLENLLLFFEDFLALIIGETLQHVSDDTGSLLLRLDSGERLHGGLSENILTWTQPLLELRKHVVALGLCRVLS